MKIFNKKENVHHWIQDYGFTEDSKSVIGEKCQYETAINTSLYTIWVAVDFEAPEIHIYVEYECGGEILRNTIDFSDIDVEDEYEFMHALDDIVHDYVERFQ